MKKLEEGDVVLCIVEKIIGTSVFVRTEDNEQGTIVTSEIAPGRIRNIRDYVVPNKKIVCKVLEAGKDNLKLSLRRVTNKEKNIVLENYKKEQSAIATLKSILKDRASKVIENIKKEGKICDFLEKARENPKILENYLTKEEAEKIYKIVCEKKGKEVQVKIEFLLSSQESNGIIKIKKILSRNKNNAEITYIAAGRFMIKVREQDYKKANSTTNQILEKIEKEAKKENCYFKVKEK